MGDPTIRGGLTLIEGIVLIPANSSSSTPRGASVAVRLIAVARSSDTILITNCPVSRIFIKVSLPPTRSVVPVKPTANSGGSEETTLKNEKGAAFNLPSLSNDVIQAIGRGKT